MNVTGGPDMTLLEVDEACNAISSEVDPDANTIFGAAFDDSLQGQIRVSVVATGMDGSAFSAIEPKPMRASAPPPRPIETPELKALAPVAPPVIAEPELLPQFQAAATVEAPTADPVIRIIDPAIEEAAEPDFALAAEAAPATIAKGLRSQPDERAAEDPLFIPSRRQAQQKAGWLSLFGGRRYEAVDEEAPVPQFRNKQAAAEVRSTSSAQLIEEAEPEDDLEIPSFLRRLAN